MWAETDSRVLCREKHDADRNESGIKIFFSQGFLRIEDPGFFRKGEVSFGQCCEIAADGSGSGNHHDVPTSLESRLVQTIDFPKSPACPVADHGMPQFLTDGDAHTIGVSPVFSCVKHQIRVSMGGRRIQPAERILLFLIITAPS